MEPLITKFQTMKNIIILGSTGSLGIQMLKVLKKHEDKFRVVGITAKTSEKLLQEQGTELGLAPTNIALNDEQKTNELIGRADIVINLISGIAGIAPTKAAIEAGKVLILGNKESAVAGILPPPEKSGLPHLQIIPIDSEHNAIFEILKKFPEEKVKTITLPASGGPFHKAKSLKGITPEQAVRHPKWNMGPKISIESATLLNKGFEIIEAHYLFNIPVENIKVVVHPECEIHGMVEFENGEIYGCFGPPNMEHHLENGLLHAIGENKQQDIRKINEASRRHAGVAATSPFKFHKPNPLLLPGIDLVLAAFNSSPANMLDFLKKEENAINDFLTGKIEFEEIYSTLANS